MIRPAKIGVVMNKSVLFRDDKLYKAFPDLAMSGDGCLICIYRESLCHGWRPFSRIIVHRSCDGGCTWTSGTVVHECADASRDGGLNNPRLLSLGGDSLLLICDWIPPNEPETTPDSTIYLWRSRDGGVSWSPREGTGIKGLICPWLTKTRSGTILLGAGRYDGLKHLHIDELFLSRDDGHTWEGPVEISSSRSLDPNEGSFVELDSGALVCYMREDEERNCAYKSISRDGGKTWEGPYPTHLSCCYGRPKAGVLRSGEVAVVYGFQRFTPPRNLILHVESQEIAADPKCLERPHDGTSPRYFFIDHDRSIHPDGAYSGWVQLPSGDLYVVQYITDDAPMAHIRSYRIERHDYLLCPEGTLANTRPWATMTYHELAREASEEQYRKNLRQRSGKPDNAL